MYTRVYPRASSNRTRPGVWGREFLALLANKAISYIYVGMEAIVDYCDWYVPGGWFIPLHS